MRTIEPENRKYFNKFGMTKGSSVDWEKESWKPMARCTFCVEIYGDAPKHDHLTLENRNGTSYLCCDDHRRHYGKEKTY